MPNFTVIHGEGLNPIKPDPLPSIIYFDAIQSPEEEERREQEIKKRDRLLRGLKIVK